LTGPLDLGRRPRRLGAFLVLVVALVGLAMAVVASPPKVGRLRALPDAPDPAELAAALGLQMPAPEVGVPRFVLRDIGGRAISAEALRGKVALISFFATWCPSCQGEMPAFRELTARFQGTDFILVLVNYGESREAVLAYAADLAFAHAILLDPGTRVGDSLAVKFLPTHFLLGRHGELVATGVGPKAWDGSDAAQLIVRLLGRGAEAGGPSPAPERRGI
jgi:thiol-disulfide isomerase/thioredoxin